jgi:8-oxo-dGTP pyrophosphatase MutT (NUDIX family)
MKNWKVIASEYLHKEEWLTIRKDTCELSTGKIIPAYYVNEYLDWVNVFALTEDDRVIMVKQYRHGIGLMSTELPGGVTEAKETPEEACRRELLEETGYEFKSFEYLGKISANPATTNNYTHMFLASGGIKVADLNLDETEELEVVFYTIEEVKALIKRNEILQSLHVNCIVYALEKLGKLSF